MYVAEPKLTTNCGANINYRFSDILSKCKTSVVSLMSRGSQSSSSGGSRLTMPRIEITAASCESAPRSKHRRKKRKVSSVSADGLTQPDKDNIYLKPRALSLSY